MHASAARPDRLAAPSCSSETPSGSLEDAFRFGHASKRGLARTYTRRQRASRSRQHHHGQHQQHQQHQHRQKRRIRAVETLAGRANLAPSIGWSGRCGPCAGALLVPEANGQAPPPSMPLEKGRWVRSQRVFHTHVAPVRAAICTVPCSQAYVAWPFGAYGTYRYALTTFLPSLIAP